MSQVPKYIKQQNCSLLKKTVYAGKVCFEAWDAGLSCFKLVMGWS